MLFKQKRSQVCFKIHWRLLTIVFSQYAVLVFSTLASTAATYLLCRQRTSIVLASNVAVLTAVSLNKREIVQSSSDFCQASLSAVYLLLHQCGAWKYSHLGSELPIKRLFSLFAWTRLLSILAVSVWIAAAILGLMVTSNSAVSIHGSVNAMYLHGWSLNDCKVQKAGMATALVAM